jgi:hypothetical protein
MEQIVLFFLVILVVHFFFVNNKTQSALIRPRIFRWIANGRKAFRAGRSILAALSVRHGVRYVSSVFQYEYSSSSDEDDFDSSLFAFLSSFLQRCVLDDSSDSILKGVLVATNRRRRS